MKGRGKKRRERGGKSAGCAYGNFHNRKKGVVMGYQKKDLGRGEGKVARKVF